MIFKISDKLSWKERAAPVGLGIVGVINIPANLPEAVVMVLCSVMWFVQVRQRDRLNIVMNLMVDSSWTVNTATILLRKLYTKKLEGVELTSEEAHDLSTSETIADMLEEARDIERKAGRTST